MQSSPIMQSRHSGVRLTENQSTATAPTMKLMNVAPGQWALAQYGNERGVAELTLVFVCGGKVYVPSYPNHQTWTATFKPLAEEISKQVIAALEVNTVNQDPAAGTIPSSDAVDVMGAPAADGGMGDVFEEKP